MPPVQLGRRYVNIKTQGLVYEGGGAVIMGANPEFSIFARNIALQTLESVTIPYPISGPVTSTRGVATIRLGSRTEQAKAAGRGLVQGIRWEHPGRLLGALVGNEILAGQLSNAETMLECGVAPASPSKPASKVALSTPMRSTAATASGCFDAGASRRFGIGENR